MKRKERACWWRWKRRVKKLSWNSTFQKQRSWHLVLLLHGKQMGKQWKQWQIIFFVSKVTEDGDFSHEIKRLLLLGRKAVTKHCCWCCLVASVMSSSVRPYGPQPAKQLCPWDSLGRSTGVGCHALHQGIFPNQGVNSDLLHCRHILYCWATREALQSIKKQKHHGTNKGPYGYTFPSSHAWIWDWTIKKDECWRTDAFKV